MPLPIAGTINNTITFHAIDRTSIYNTPQIIVQDVSSVSMAGGIRRWMGKRAKISKIVTITYTSRAIAGGGSGLTAVDFETQCRALVGYVVGLNIATSVSANDLFWFEVADVNIKHDHAQQDGDPSDTESKVQWTGYLVRQAKNTSAPGTGSTGTGG